MPGVTLSLYDAGNNLITSTVSGASGYYNWRVRVEGGAWSAARRFVIRIP